MARPYKRIELVEKILANKAEIASYLSLIVNRKNDPQLGERATYTILLAHLGYTTKDWSLTTLKKAIQDAGLYIPLNVDFSTIRASFEKQEAKIQELKKQIQATDELYKDINVAEDSKKSIKLNKILREQVQNYQRQDSQKQSMIDGMRAEARQTNKELVKAKNELTKLLDENKNLKNCLEKMKEAKK